MSENAPNLGLAKKRGSIEKNGVSYRQELDADYTISSYIYNYLTCKSNSLVKFTYVKDAINNTKSDFVSVAYGLVLDKDLKISYEEPLDNGCTSRYDVITKDSHVAYFRTGSKVEDINLEELPIFKEERVKNIQRYLFLIDKFLEDSKSKSK